MFDFVYMAHMHTYTSTILYWLDFILESHIQAEENHDISNIKTKHQYIIFEFF